MKVESVLSESCPWPLDDPRTVRVSQGQVSDFRTCPYRWAMRKMCGVMDAGGEPAAVGSAFHDFAGSYARHCIANRLNSDAGVVSELVNQAVLRRVELTPEGRQLVRETCQNFAASHGFPTDPIEQGAEATFWIRLEVGGIIVIIEARPDYWAHDKRQGASGVIDYKAGEQMMTSRELDESIQGRTYLLPLWIQRRPNRMTYTFDYVRMGVSPTREVTGEQLRELLRHYAEDGVVMRGALDRLATIPHPGNEADLAEWLTEQGVRPGDGPRDLWAEAVNSICPAKPGVACYRSGPCPALNLCVYASRQRISPPTNEGEAAEAVAVAIYKAAELSVLKDQIAGYVEQTGKPIVVGGKVAQRWPVADRAWAIDKVMAVMERQGRNLAGEAGLSIDGSSRFGRELIRLHDESVALLLDRASKLDAGEPDPLTPEEVATHEERRAMFTAEDSARFDIRSERKEKQPARVQGRRLRRKQ